MALVPEAPQVVGITELPANKQKQSGVPEVAHADTMRLLELDGTRLAWSQACICPCAPISSTTDSPDPTCPKCQGRGWFWFAPIDYVLPDAVGNLTPSQLLYLKDGDTPIAACIRGIVTRGQIGQTPFEVIGNWMRGDMFVSVRPENRLGYYDRLVNLDAEIAYYENITMPATGNITLRYLATNVNTLESITTRYVQGIDFVVTDGKLEWIRIGNRPASATRLAVSYYFHPAWLVVNYPHAVRATQIRRKLKNTTTPFGEPQPLAIQALIRFEFLVKRETPFT